MEGQPVRSSSGGSLGVNQPRWSPRRSSEPVVTPCTTRPVTRAAGLPIRPMIFPP